MKEPLFKQTTKKHPTIDEFVQKNSKESKLTSAIRQTYGFDSRSDFKTEQRHFEAQGFRLF